MLHPRSRSDHLIAHHPRSPEESDGVERNGSAHRKDDQVSRYDKFARVLADPDRHQGCQWKVSYLARFCTFLVVIKPSDEIDMKQGFDPLDVLFDIRRLCHDFLRVSQFPVPSIVSFGIYAESQPSGWPAERSTLSVYSR